jgi:two-component system, sensor histidine kinase and response regulator
MRSSAAVDRKSDLQLELQDVWGNIEEASLQKLVGELVDNAFKFSEPGSKVIVSSQLRGGCCEIAVLDEGLGMTPEQIDSIAAFRQFGRECAEQQGLGLGLSIASRLARLWGGKLEIESRAGGGTMVRLELPVAVPVAAQPTAHAFVN